MKNGTGNSIRLFVAAVLTFGGLVAMVIGIVMAVAPSNAPICDLVAACIAQPAIAPVADGVHRSAVD